MAVNVVRDVMALKSEAQAQTGHSVGREDVHRFDVFGLAQPFGMTAQRCWRVPPECRGATEGSMRLPFSRRANCILLLTGSAGRNDGSFIKSNPAVLIKRPCAGFAGDYRKSLKSDACRRCPSVSPVARHHPFWATSCRLAGMQPPHAYDVGLTACSRIAHMC